MKPTVGRIVLYTLSADDAAQINRRRTSGTAIAERIRNNSVPFGTIHISEPIPPTWPLGAQAHIGNDAVEGDVVPLIVVRCWSETAVNGQALLDGNDQLWVISAVEGEGPRTWAWPRREPILGDSLPASN
ncbi:MAG TPA: hypothetical protein VGU67_02865 [Edaphobacter sp.]|nr:hypothetical protein [Edaphobacter sp.]